MSDAQEVFARLRRLRREGHDVKTGAKTGGEGTLPVWLARRLAARGRRRGAPESAAAPDETHPVPRSLDPPSGLIESDGPEGRFAVRERLYPRSHHHGDWSLEEVFSAALEDVETLTSDPSLENLDLESAVYLDIETTGLAGGAGTIPFLVALGDFTSDGFRLWQGFIAGPEEERALLAEVACRVRAASGLVSFFGKSFDRHRLEDKMRLHGIEPPFEGLPHLDLFHPLARLYRAGFDDVRLATVEAALCGVVREADLPGSYAPEAWYDFVAGRPHRLESVFQHNADDVLSLVVLAAHLGRTLTETRSSGAALAGPAGPRALALARLFAARRDPPEALRWIACALARSPEHGRSLRVLRADVRRLARDDRSALEEYEVLAGEARDELTIHCLVQAAKLAEHRTRELERALAAVERARDLIMTCAPASRRARYEEDLSRRAQRLARKRERQAAAAGPERNDRPRRSPPG